MLSSKSKILFFTIHHYYGHVKGLEFRFSPYGNYQTRLLAPMIRGQISNDHPTIVDLKFQLPIIPGFFLVMFPLMFVPSLLTSDEMTINGVLREPTMNERIGFTFFSLGVPAFIYYMNFIRPLQKLHRVIKAKLKLEEKA